MRKGQELSHPQQLLLSQALLCPYQARPVSLFGTEPGGEVHIRTCTSGKREKYILGLLGKVATWTRGSLSSWWKTVLRWEERSRDQPTTLPATLFSYFLSLNFGLVFTSAVPRDQSAPCLAPLQDDNCCMVDCRHLERKN